MSRYIDADDVLDNVDKKLEAIIFEENDSYDVGYENGVDLVVDLIHKSPTVEIVPQGNWEVDRSKGWVCCTNCHNEMPLRYIPGGTFHKENFKSPYCPYCGAKMGNGLENS